MLRLLRANRVSHEYISLVNSRTMKPFLPSQVDAQSAKLNV